MTKEATINAVLKLALEALSVCTSDNWADKELQGKAWDACKEALTSTQCEKQPAQEPVAWMYVNVDGECEQIEYGPIPFLDDSITFLYTTPPQRPWVSLTDIEIMKIINSNTSTGLWYMAIEIAAKLKEKNT